METVLNRSFNPWQSVKGVAVYFVPCLQQIGGVLMIWPRKGYNMLVRFMFPRPNLTGAYVRNLLYNRTFSLNDNQLNIEIANLEEIWSKYIKNVLDTLNQKILLYGEYNREWTNDETFFRKVGTKTFKVQNIWRYLKTN